MELPIANISENDIDRLVKRDFHPEEVIEILKLLSLYQSETLNGKNRVHASILKLSNGNISKVRNYIEMANNDYRDVIALAEYPNFSEHAFNDDLVEDKVKQLENSDYVQYAIWFNKR